MTRTSPNKYARIVLPLIGAGSGILSMTMPQALSVLIGGVFGAFIAAYLVLFEELRSIRKAGFVFVASLVAYPAAYFGSIFVTQLPPWLVYGIGSDNVDISIVFGGGLIGGFLVAVSVILVFRSPRSNRWTDFGVALFGSLYSGFLGVAGWILGPSLGKALWALLPSSALPSVNSFNLYSLYLVWQAGMALFIGLVVAWKQRRIHAPNGRTATAPGLRAPLPSAGQPAASKILLVVGVVLLGFVLARAVPIRMGFAKRQDAVAKRLAETPSKLSLPRIQLMSVDEALIVSDVAGLHPKDPLRHVEGESNEKGFIRPPGMYYGVSYLPAGANSYYGPGTVAVSVQQYPNSQWASYLAKYPHNIVNLFDDPKNPAVVTKFQNRVASNILKLGPAVPLYFIWPSGNNVVTITYNTPNGNNEEFLRLYLEKYPSSLD